MLSKAFASLVCLFVVAAQACAEHKIIGDRNIPAHSFAELSVEGKFGVIWIVAPEPVKQVTKDGTLYLAGVPGRNYVVTAVVIDFDKRTVDAATATVKFGVGPDPKPDPGPAPEPGPQPDPPTPAGKLVVVLIEETKQAVANRGAFFADRDLVAAMKTKGHKWRCVDQDVEGPDGKPPADVARFITDAKAKGLPQLYLVGENGKAVYSGPVPKTPAELVALLKKHGG